MPDVDIKELFAGMQEQMAVTLRLHTGITESVSLNSNLFYVR